MSIVTDDEGGRGIGEVLGVVGANVAAIPVVVGFVALGGLVLTGRLLLDVAAQALGSRNGRPSRRRKRLKPTAP